MQIFCIIWFKFNFILSGMTKINPIQHLNLNILKNYKSVKQIIYFNA